MRSYEMFVSEFTNALQLNMEQEGLAPRVEREQMEAKINGPQDTLTIHFEGMEIAPIIYLRENYDLFCNGTAIEEMAEAHTDSIKNFYEHPPKVPEFNSDFAKENLICTLVNAEQNEELLRKVPHERVLDLAIIPRLRFGEASATVTEDLCQQLHLTGEEVMEIARKNTETAEYVCEDMEDIMRGFFGVDIPDGESENKGFMFVLTNRERVDGAIAMVSEKIMTEACNQIGEAVYVLPSSRHETILIPESAVSGDLDHLKDIVRTVNTTELSPKDFLSNSVYHFDGRKLTIVAEKSKELTKEAIKTAKKIARR